MGVPGVGISLDPSTLIQRQQDTYMLIPRTGHGVGVLLIFAAVWTAAGLF